MKKYYRLGRLPFSVTGDTPLGGIISEEIASIASDEVASTLNFSFGAGFGTIPGAISAKPLSIGNGMFQVEQGGMNYTCEVGRDSVEVNVIQEPLRISLKRRVLPAWLFRARDWNYLSRTETVAKNFMYDIFDYITQIEGLKVGQTYIHASSFEKNGSGVAVLAWGGVGKTTSMLKLVSEGGYRFLSDDLGVMDEDGNLYRSPKKMQIYAYNLIGQSLLKELLMKDRSVLDRLSWEWRKWRYGNHLVRRRVAAEELFGPEAVCKKAPLRIAIFAERADVPQFSVSPVEGKELANRAAAIVMKEIDPFYHLWSAMEGTGIRLLPSPEELRLKTRHTIQKGLESAESFLWRIPLKAGPDEIAAQLATIIERS